MIASVNSRATDVAGPADRQIPLWTAGPPLPRLSIRESRRSRRLCVRVDPHLGVEVVVPHGTPRARVARFLASHEDWIAHRVAAFAARPPVAFPPPAIELTAVCERWRVHLAGGAGRARLASPAAGLLQVRGEVGRAELAALLRRWVVRRGQALLPSLARALAAEHGCDVRAVQVRTQRTRWGSCSSRGVLSLNAALLFQTPAVLRYLVAHELAHLRHMNHSAAFRARVAELEPRFRELDRELTRTGWQRVPQWFRSRGGAA